MRFVTPSRGIRFVRLIWGPYDFLSIQNIRAKMREMGRASGVAIEPPPQTDLLDDCLAVSGVIAGGVPGGS